MKLELTEKQAEYVKSATHRWNFAVGAVRSGKSHLACLYTIPKGITERIGKKGINLILGATRETIERNVLTPMRNMYGTAMVGEIRGSNVTRLFGEQVYCIGAESRGQVSKIRGSEVKFCYIDEVCDVSEDVFDILKSRLSLPYSECHAACNPVGPNHYVKKFLDQEGLDLYYQKYTIFDNPFLPKEYVENLCKEYDGTVYYKRYILGEWALAEGLIYPMYTEVLSDVPKWKKDEKRQYCLSIDYGTKNAFAALLWEKHGDTWYAQRGYYYSGRETGLPKTDWEYANELDTMLEDVSAYYEKISAYGLKQKLETIVDPSAASFIAVLNKRPLYKVRGGNNNVADGIRETASAMRLGKIKVNRTIKEWEKEAEGYIWEDNEGQEKPIKVNDHYMDATRYFVKTKRIVVPKTQYTPIFGA